MNERDNAMARFRSGEMKVDVAAIRTRGGEVFSLPRPARHDAVIRLVFKKTGQKVTTADEQGFLSDCGIFLSRKQAEAVARRSGQLTGPVIGGSLTSEDLW